MGAQRGWLDTSTGSTIAQVRPRTSDCSEGYQSPVQFEMAEPGVSNKLSGIANRGKSRRCLR